jgi:fluoride exporter
MEDGTWCENGSQAGASRGGVKLNASDEARSQPRSPADGFYRSELTSSEKETAVDASGQEFEREYPPDDEVVQEIGFLRAGHPRIATTELVAVAVGGAAGACARVGLATSWLVTAGAWPWATFTANIVGAFLLGLIVAALRRHGGLSIAIYRLTGTGFCGALTTFSTMQVELLRMLEQGRLGLAAGYLSASLVAGYLAMSLGPRLLGRPALAGEPTLEQA